jgi:hypothetical protein
MPGSEGNARQTRRSASQETTTKGEKVDTNAYAALLYDSDASYKEEGEEDIREEIEIAEAPGAPRAKRVLRPQTPTKSQKNNEKDNMISDMCRIMDRIHDSLEWLKRDNKALRGEMANL